MVLYFGHQCLPVITSGPLLWYVRSMSLRCPDANNMGRRNLCDAQDIVAAHVSPQGIMR